MDGSFGWEIRSGARPRVTSYLGESRVFVRSRRGELCAVCCVASDGANYSGRFWLLVLLLRCLLTFCNAAMFWGKGGQ